MSAPRRIIHPLAWILILSILFFSVFLIVSGILFAYKTSNHANSHGSSSFFGASRAVGLIELQGEITDSKKILSRLERAEEEDQIQAVVLRVNSPGGAVAPSQEIYEAVKSFKKPLVVSMGSVAASGAFYISCGAKKVFANPGTLTGSIGVIMQFANLEKLYDWAKVHRYSVKTGKFKDIGAEYRAMTEDEMLLISSVENEILEQFKKAIAQGRNLSPDAVAKIADGRIFSGSQAKELHLVDELGSIQDAIQEAGKLAKIKGKPKVIHIGKLRRNLRDFLFDDSPPESSSYLQSLWNLKGIISLLMGQAEYSPQMKTLTPGVYWIWEHG